MKNKALCLLPVAFALAPLTSCGYSESKTQIGVLQFGSFQALEEAKRGFVETLSASSFKDKVEIDVQNPESDSATNASMASTLASKSDLVFGIATPSAVALKTAVDSFGSNIPVLFSAVTNPVGANLVNSLESSGNNVTGVTDLGDIAKGLSILEQFNVDNVVSFFTSTETNSVYQASIAEKWMDAKGWEHSRKTITSASEISLALASIPGSVDAVFLPTDDTIANSIAMVKAANESRANPLVIFGCDVGMIGGVTFALGVDYFECGVQAGKQAIEILNGKKPSEIAVESCDKSAISINKTGAESLGIAIPESVLAIEGAEIQ